MVGLQNWYRQCGEEKNFVPTWTFNSSPSAIQPEASCCTQLLLLAIFQYICNERNYYKVHFVYQLERFIANINITGTCE